MSPCASWVDSVSANAALACCEKQIESPAKAQLLLITDLFEGGDAESKLGRAALSSKPL
jgi:hypothetical protein